MDNRKILLEANIWKYYLYRLFAGLMLTIPLFLLFYQENGLSMTQIMVLQAVYTFVILVLEIPMGALADIWGRRNTLVISTAFFALAFVGYALSYNFWHFFIIQFVWGVSEAAFMGTGEAFLYDTLLAIGKENKYKKVQGKADAINEFVGGFAGIFGAMIAAAISMRFTFWLSAIPIVIATFVVFSFKEPEHEKKLFDKKFVKHMKEALAYTKGHPKLKFSMIFAAMWYSFTFILYYLHSLYLKNIGISIGWFGVVFALFAAMHAIGSLSTHHLEEKLGERNTVIFIVIGYFITTVAIAFIHSWVGIVFSMIAWFFGGLNMTLVPHMINIHTGSEHRATIHSIKNMVSNLILTIVSPMIGYMTDVWSLDVTFILMGIFFIGYMLYVLFYYRYVEKS